MPSKMANSSTAKTCLQKTQEGIGQNKLKEWGHNSSILWDKSMEGYIAGLLVQPSLGDPSRLHAGNSSYSEE